MLCVRCAEKGQHQVPLKIVSHSRLVRANCNMSHCSDRENGVQCMGYGEGGEGCCQGRFSDKMTFESRPKRNKGEKSCHYLEVLRTCWIMETICFSKIGTCALLYANIFMSSYSGQTPGFRSPWSWFPNRSVGNSGTISSPWTVHQWGEAWTLA